MYNQHRRSRGLTLIEMIAALAVVAVLVFLFGGGCNLLTRKIMNPVYLERAQGEALKFATAQGWVLKGSPVCSTVEIDERYPCTLTLDGDRIETLLCAADYFGLESGCIPSTPYVTGRGRGVVNTGN